MLFQAHSAPSQKVDSCVSVFLEPTSNSIVYGCPGIPRSIPRIETTVHIRSTNALPFMIRAVAVFLISRQKVVVPTKFGSNDAFKEFKLYEDSMAFKPANDFSQKVLGVSLPILIPVPRDIPSSALLSSFGSSTTHSLVVKVILGDSAANESFVVETFPIVIKTYDTLPLYRQFNEPLVRSSKSPDNQIIAEAVVPVTAVGPSDLLCLNCRIFTNSANNKLKKHITLKQITFQIKEYLECYDGGLPPVTENKLFTTTLEPGKEVTTQGIQENYSINFPQSNDYLKIHSFEEPYIIEQETMNDYETTIIESANISSFVLKDKLGEGLPLTHFQSFTSLSQFYSIKFELILKLKFSKAKDFDVRIPIIVCPYDRKTSEPLLKWIMLECEVAKARFGKQFIDQFFAAKNYLEICSLMDKYRPPPVIYRYCKEDWEKLGYDGVAFNNPRSPNLVLYID